jgi:hypothetical protein
MSRFHLGLLQCQSVRIKSTGFQRWFNDNLSLAALVETWHDGADSPDIATAPHGYDFVEQARPSPDTLSLSANRGGVCLMHEQHDSGLHARLVQLPTFTTFQSICVLIQCSSFNAVVVAIDRPDSLQVTNTFFAEFCDIMERVGTFAAPLVVLGISTSTLMTRITQTTANWFSRLTESHSARQSPRTSHQAHYRPCADSRRPVCVAAANRSIVAL